MTVTRLREDAVTVAIPGLREAFPGLEDKDARLRLRGRFYRADFDPAAPPVDEHPNPERAAALAVKLNGLKEKRAAYHHYRYGKPEAVNDNVMRHHGPDLATWLDKQLGSHAVRPDPLSFRQGRASMRRRHLRRRRILHRNAALGTSWIEEVLEPEPEK